MLALFCCSWADFPLRLGLFQFDLCLCQFSLGTFPSGPLLFDAGRIQFAVDLR